jgi:hypothetical protein
MSDAYAVPLPVTIKAVPRSSRSTVVLGVVFGVIIAFMKGPPDTPTIHLGVRRPAQGLHKS